MHVERERERGKIRNYDPVNYQKQQKRSKRELTGKRETTRNTTRYNRKMSISSRHFVSQYSRHLFRGRSGKCPVDNRSAATVCDHYARNYSISNQCPANQEHGNQGDGRKCPFLRVCETSVQEKNKQRRDESGVVDYDRVSTAMETIVNSPMAPSRASNLAQLCPYMKRASAAKPHATSVDHAMNDAWMESRCNKHDHTRADDGSCTLQGCQYSACPNYYESMDSPRKSESTSTKGIVFFFFHHVFGGLI